MIYGNKEISVVDGYIIKVSIKDESILPEIAYFLKHEMKASYKKIFHKEDKNRYDIEISYLFFLASDAMMFKLKFG